MPPTQRYREQLAAILLLLANPLSLPRLQSAAIKAYSLAADASAATFPERWVKAKHAVASAGQRLYVVRLSLVPQQKPSPISGGMNPNERLTTTLRPEAV